MRPRTRRLSSAFDVRLLMSVNGLAVLFFGILPECLMGLCLTAIQASLQ